MKALMRNHHKKLAVVRYIWIFFYYYYKRKFKKIAFHRKMRLKMENVNKVFYRNGAF